MQIFRNGKFIYLVGRDFKGRAYDNMNFFIEIFVLDVN